MDRKDIGPVPGIWPARPPERPGPRKHPPAQRPRDDRDEARSAPDGEDGAGHIDDYA